MIFSANEIADKSRLARQLAQRIDARTACVGILGLGYVGLPLVDAYLRAGFSVVGFDVDHAKVAQLGRSESYIAHISADTISHRSTAW